jgi:Protein of unknown function (DUF3800)
MSQVRSANRPQENSSANPPEPSYPPEANLYIYVDEAGNFDFSPRGTKYFIMTCVTVCRPFPAQQRLLEVKYDHLQTGLDLECFHASEDRQAVRDKVFAAIADGMSAYRTYSVILRKNKTNPVLQEPARLYPKTFGMLMKYVLPRRCDGSIKTVVVVTDSFPDIKKRRAMEKAVKTTLKPLVPSGTTYYLYQHQSRADINLQIADYFSWAIYRKWENNDLRSYDLIKAAVKAEGDLFAGGDKVYY